MNRNEDNFAEKLGASSIQHFQKKRNSTLSSISTLDFRWASSPSSPAGSSGRRATAARRPPLPRRGRASKYPTMMSTLRPPSTRRHFRQGSPVFRLPGIGMSTTKEKLTDSPPSVLLPFSRQQQQQQRVRLRLRVLSSSSSSEGGSPLPSCRTR